jgi:integrase
MVSRSSWSKRAIGISRNRASRRKHVTSSGAASSSNGGGGEECTAKVAQHLLGHSSIVMTLDRYGHLFPSGGDRSELAASEQALLG